MSLSKRARDYGAAILVHSHRSVADSLYPGQNYAYLARILGESPGLGRLGDLISCAPADHSTLAVLYDLKVPDIHAGTDISCKKFKVDDYCLLQDLPEPQESGGQLLFVRGHLSEEWIKTIGGKYRVDPEFFQRHLALPSAPIYESALALPTLPSSTRNIIRLSVSTIACQDPNALTIDLSHLQDVQARDAVAMDQYFRRLSKSLKPGDSIVRAYKTLSERFSIIEQDISICLETSGKGWIAIVLLDNGNSLQKSPNGPWMERTRSGVLASTMLPVQQHRKHIALKGMLHLTSSSAETVKPNLSTKQSFFQSASLLPLEYCRFLDHEIARHDFIFALADVFRFAAYSETQCLNLLQLLIDGVVRQRQQTQIHPPSEEPEPTHMLVEYRAILDRHQQRLEEILATLRRREHSGWPMAEKEAHRWKAANEARRLEEDYQHLVSRTRELASACQDGMAMVMHQAVITEAKKAMEQTERMRKLTILATFFIPLSFTSSVFGMNTTEFSNQNLLSIWVWFAVTAPIVLLTVLLYVCDMSVLKQRLKWVLKRAFKPSKK